MYNPISIAPLSESQILKALKGLPVRVSAGNQHDIALSAEQFKKFAKANQKGKASTITFDPFQIQNHMGLKGSGVLKKNVRGNAGRLITSATDRAIRAMSGSGKLKKTARGNAGRLITSATDRAIRAISGSGAMQDMQVRLHQKDALKASDRYGLDNGDQYEDDAYYEYGIGGNITAVAKDSGKSVITASGDRAVRAIEGSGVNRLKKAGRWEQFANATLRDGIDTAGKAARVYYDSTGPMAQMGFGLKKRGRPRKSGGALYVA